MSSTAAQPHFEPLDLFDFDPQDLPPPERAPAPVIVDDGPMDFDMEIELAMAEEDRNATAGGYNGADSPPTINQPDEWEDEMMREDASSTINRLETSTVRATSTTTVVETQVETSTASFGRSDIFDSAPIASSSRTLLDPLPDIIPALAPSPPCHLPPLSAETASGRTVHFKRRSKPRAPPPSHDIQTNAFGTSSLLSEPLHHLLLEVQDMRFRERALQQQIREESKRRRNVTVITTAQVSTTMWVDKYRPKKFSDLLGEERVHREIMGWLKEWDKCVFRRANPPKKRRFDEDEKENFPVDPLGRPRDRILLLSGPPGYGKTTLAHVVARQAGYKSLEINASDDRSAATVSVRIKNALESGSGLASEGKPTCVVIDEIDGASGGGDASFVRSLIKLIQDVPARKKTNTPAKPLRRPIICICNDLYATSLRPLRPFARVIRFRKPQAQFLVKRLRDICERETLSADMRVLTSLVEMTTGDVRSCLNTLQFIKSKSSVVTDEAIKSSAVGLKDSGTTLQSAWNDIFIPISAKVRRKTAGIDDGKYVTRLANTITSCGEYERLVQGAFEHYPNLKPLDASFQNIVKIHDWLGYYDRIWGKVNENQDFELMGYLPYAVVPWHSHMAAPANISRPTEWPKADYESYQTRTVNEEVATSLKSTIPAVLRSLFSSTTTLTELIPLLMRIISPPLKPVNANIVKPAEKAVLNRLVELLIPLGLHFWQEKGENGQPMMRLEPPIDVFIHYDGKRADDIAASRFAVRQLVAQAMDAESARRRGQTTDGTTGAAQLHGAYGAAKRGQLVATATEKSEAAATDFFGRAVTKQPSILIGGESPNDDVFADEQPQKKFRVLYKFHEGSSSAVRKNIKMSALM